MDSLTLNELLFLSIYPTTLIPLNSTSSIFLGLLALKVFIILTMLTHFIVTRPVI